jgi:hypothetical protein
MALVFGGPGLGTLHTSGVVKPTPVASKQAAPNKTTQAKQTVLKQTTPTKAVVTPDPYAAALAAQPSLATLLAQASTQANTLAQQQVNAQVAAIQQQQDQAHATAAAQSAEILKAATAAAQFLTPLGDQAAGDYTAAVQNLGGMVGGYTGGLRDTAQAAQDAAQAQLAGISGNTQTVEGHGADLANLLYGVSGSIPANALATQGLGATALARAIPQQTLSYGQQQAIGVLGQGNQTADALNTQLATARAQLPTLTQQYLKQFQDSAQNVADQAHQRLMDANTIRNTTSEIATRNATLKQRTAAAAAKLKPVLDVGKSKLTGVLTDQFGKPITKNVGGKQFLQTLPGFHFDNAGRVIADPKPVTLDQQSARAAEWTRVHHYQSDWQGNAIINPKTKALIPTGGWVVSPDGQTAVPPPKPGKAFVPKIDRISSQATKKLTYIGEDGALHYFYDANKNPIPYDPGTKPAALKLINTGGIYVWADPNTGKVYGLHDDNGVPLPVGTPKGPATAHYGGRFIDAATGHYMLTNSLTGETIDTGHTAPASAIKSEGTWSNLPADKYGHIYRINNKTNEIQPITGYQGRVPGSGTSAAGGKAGPGSSTWRLTSNRVDTQLQSWAKPPTPAWTYDYVKGWIRKPGTGAVVTDAQGNQVPAGPEPKLYDDALQWALDQYSGPNTKAWQARARKLVNDAYPMNGENGRPLEGGLAIAAANDYAKAMLKRGATAAAALTAGLTQPYWRLDPSVLRKAISRIYPTPPSPLPPLGTIPTMPAGVIGGPPSAYAIP